MSEFKSEVDKALDRFYTGTGRITQLSFLSQYTRTLFTKDKSREEFLQDLSEDEIEMFADAFPDCTPYVSKYGPREGYWRWSRSLPRKSNRWLYQQLVVFLVTIFEAFLEDVLLATFRKEPRCMSSDRNISWKQVIELGDYDSIVGYIALRRAADILSGDWHKIVDEFRNLFNIDLDASIETKPISEIFEIRQAVVHNAGSCDLRFMNKIQKSEWGILYNLDKDIILNKRVLDRMVSSVDYAAVSISELILNKFGAT